MWMLLTAASVVGYAAYKLFYQSAPSAVPGAPPAAGSIATVSTPAGPIAVGDFVAVKHIDDQPATASIPQDFFQGATPALQVRMQITSLGFKSLNPTMPDNPPGIVTATLSDPRMIGVLVPGIGIETDAIIAKLT